MATEQASVPINGTYAGTQAFTYTSQDQGSANQPGNPSPAGGGSASSQSTSSTAQDIPKEEVAWYFVEQYYTTLSRTPERLYLFFNKRSQFVSGLEDEKVAVCAGQKAIRERIAELEFKDAKVRVTNVDSQASDTNIVIQVIGELSNNSEPHRKFVQTFVLAGQTNGYFVLNDIFRYIKDEEEEPVADELQPESTVATGGYLEPAPTAEHAAPEVSASEKETVVPEQAAAQVDKELEEVIDRDETRGESEEHSTMDVNGTPASEQAELEHVEAPPATADSIEENHAPDTTEASTAATEEAESEKATEPAPTPAAAPKPNQKPAVPSGPPKPAVPKTWAQLAGGGKSAAAAAASPAPNPTAPQPKQAQPTQAQSAPVQAPVQATIATPPPRESSPAEGSQESSQGGWQTAGADHSRKQSRTQTQPAPADNGKVRAYVKNVYPAVDATELKTHLSKFGELAYFDVSRQKNSAFVEFNTRAGFDAAVAANPHKLGNENIYVEERRTMQGQQGHRGSFRGGAGRQFDQRGRGNFGGPRGRGGSLTPRGGRPAPTAA